MKPGAELLLDPRRAAQLAAQLRARGPGYLAAWEPPEGGAGAALIAVWARYLEAVLDRLNRSPEKNRLAFLELLGIELNPARAARAPVVFQLSETAAAVRVPAASQVAAPPPPESSDQVVFETERDLGLSPARLQQVVSLWPGRDQYLDHSADVEAGESLTAFERPLGDMPHALYLAHDTLLALAGKVTLDVELELTQAGSERLDVVWEYWDGEIWRGFREQHPECAELGEERLDGTVGLTRSGRFRLETDCAESAETTVNEIEALWIRGRLDEPLPADPEQILPEVAQVRLSNVIERGPSLKSVETSFGLAAEVRLLVDNQGSNAGQLAEIELEDERGLIHRATAGDNDSVTFVPTLEWSGDYPLEIVWKGSSYQPSFTYLGVNPGTRVEFTVTLTDDSAEIDSGSTVYGQAETSLVVGVEDTNGGGIPGLDVELLDEVGQVLEAAVTDSAGQAVFTQALASEASYDVQLTLLGATFSSTLTYRPPESGATRPLVAFVLDQGLLPDLAFADAEELDLTGTFYPFGRQPRPGTAFYFASEEAFGKPGAHVTLSIRGADTPEGEFDVSGSSGRDLRETLAWEYWNGREWFALAVEVEEADESLTAEFDVPDDLAAVAVNDQEALWVRVRLVSGGFGFVQTVVFEDDQNNKNSFTYVIPRPPALAGFRITYVWEYGPFHAERVLAHNDFRYADHTETAKWPGSSFQPFQQTEDVTPALYLGFDQKLPVDRLNLYFHLDERSEETEAPALVWEYWRGDNWRQLQADDETRDLLYPGMVSFIGPEDAESLDRFGDELYWLRARLKEDAPPPEPRIDGIHLNAVWVSQWQTLANETLGTSTGRADQILTFRQIPVLEDERLEVREVSGPRANVEWRLIAVQVLGEDPRVLTDLEDLLGQEGAQTDIERGDLRLRRDRHKRVTEVWVRWSARPHLLASGPDDRHYVLERARGRLIFGDGEHGRIPPLGAEVQAREYRSGGGRSGNVEAGAISQALTGIAGVEKVLNPRAAEGGADAETLESLARRGPRTLRHRGRGLAAADLETLALEASSAVGVARAVPLRDPAGRARPGWATLTIIPRGEERRPWPSFGLRETVRRYIEERTAACLAADHRIFVTGPEYREIEVEATLAPVDPAEAGEVAVAAREAVEGFLHPLSGGPEGRGWEPGRDVFLSDLAAVLERAEGVDYVRDLALYLDGRLQGESARVPEGETVVAGEVRIKLLTEDG